MVICTRSHAVDLRFTAELWVNEAFIPAVSCHDLFAKCGIVFMHAHITCSKPVTHTV